MTNPSDKSADHLPPGQGLVDALAAEFEQCWRGGGEPEIQDFLARVDVPARPVLLERLLALKSGLLNERHGDLQARLDELAERLRANRSRDD